MNILSVEHLTKVYGTGATAVRALDDVSFTVEAGEFIAIIGSSGSGKSTLLHLMGGVDRPTSGTVRLQGQDIFARSDEELAVFDVNEQRLKMLLRSLGLTGREHYLPNQLSGGQQQRVAIGRALMNAPAVVLADEPTGNLDSKNSAEIMQLLRDSNRQLKQTLIVITHDEDIALMADRVLAIEDGRLVRDERRREVRTVSVRSKAGRGGAAHNAAHETVVPGTSVSPAAHETVVPGTSVSGVR